MGHQIGLVGLGIMGRPMARNLMKAGHSLTVHDMVRPAVDELVAQGAMAETSSKGVAAKNPIVVTMLPDSADSEAVILGPDGVLSGASAGSVVIDMSSIAPGTSQKIAAACEAKGVDFLDAPVSGGPHGAVAGTLTVMVGGEAVVFERARPLLEALGSLVAHVGGRQFKIAPIEIRVRAGQHVTQRFGPHARPDRSSEAVELDLGTMDG